MLPVLVEVVLLAVLVLVASASVLALALAVWPSLALPVLVVAADVVGRDVLAVVDDELEVVDVLVSLLASLAVPVMLAVPVVAGSAAQASSSDDAASNERRGIRAASHGRGPRGSGRKWGYLSGLGVKPRLAELMQ